MFGDHGEPSLLDNRVRVHSAQRQRWRPTTGLHAALSYTVFRILPASRAEPTSTYSPAWSLMALDSTLERLSYAKLCVHIRSVTLSIACEVNILTSVLRTRRVMIYN